LFSICRLRILNKVNDLNKKIKKVEKPLEERISVFRSKGGRISTGSKGGTMIPRPAVADYPYPNYIPMRFESV